jgi:hypothetical protein
MNSVEQIFYRGPKGYAEMVYGCHGTGKEVRKA